jgi:hypothetical protein
MPKYAQIDNGIVTGILIARSMPTHLPAGRSFVEITDAHGDVQGGEGYGVSAGAFTASPYSTATNGGSR